MLLFYLKKRNNVLNDKALCGTQSSSAHFKTQYVIGERTKMIVKIPDLELSCGDISQTPTQTTVT